ncbi:MAG TPA: BON domain-containing protein [Vicinamibacterales bacterium]|nr:BON domain-containing protein [Vicinamibacterales bacterium]
MKATISTLLLAIGLFVAPSVASAQMPVRDRAVLEQISNQVNRYTQYTIFDSISAGVEDGRVTLSGWVTMPYKREDLERRVRSVDGVVSIENGIEVLPVSTFDDELRFRIARAIYGNSSFWQYASMVNPPIHVVVRNGRVTLEGVVNSNVERMLARSLATGFGAFEVTNALRTTDEVREGLASDR